MALVISVLLIGLSDALISGILQHGFAGIMIGFLHFCQGLLRMAIETAMAMAVGALGLICVLAITIVYRMLNQPFDRLGLVQGLIELVTTIGSGLWGLAHRVCVTIRIEPAREQTL